MSAFLEGGGDAPLVFEQLPFSHPLYILYSSGTTGPPKCIIHTAGASSAQTIPVSIVTILMRCTQGVLLNSKKDLRVHIGLTENDTYFQYTTVNPRLQDISSQIHIQTDWMDDVAVYAPRACVWHPHRRVRRLAVPPRRARFPPVPQPRRVSSTLPSYPRWQCIIRVGPRVSVFGTSPRFLSEVQGKGIEPGMPVTSRPRRLVVG